MHSQRLKNVVQDGVPSIIIVAFLSALAGFGPAPYPGSQATKTAIEEPLKQWTGSTLGMKGAGYAPKKFYVAIVRAGLAADRTGLKPYDRLIRVGKIDLLTQTNADLQKYLDGIPPNSKIMVTVGRREGKDGKASEEEKRIELELVTDSKALADGWAVAELISRNRVIIDSLKSRGSLESLDQFKEKLLAKIRKAPDPRTAYEIINEQMDKLDVSHCAIIPRWNYDSRVNKSYGKIGLALKRINLDGVAKYFVVDMEPGGPAKKSPVRIGDQVVSINGIELEKSGRLSLAGMEQRHQFFSIAARTGESLRVAYRHKQDGAIQFADIETSNDLNAVSATHSSVKVFSHGEKRIGYIRLWDLLTMNINTCLEAALKDSFEGCDVLIVDLRGRGGKIGVVNRIQKTISTSGFPIVSIIDKHTRSAKEVLAYRLKQSEGALLVGQRTCGATTWSTTTKLPSGAGLMFPVINAKQTSVYSEGVVLENKGVKPDVGVNFFLPYSRGRDPLLNTAKDQAAKLVK